MHALAPAEFDRTRMLRIVVLLGVAEFVVVWVALHVNAWWALAIALVTVTGVPLLLLAFCFWAFLLAVWFWAGVDS